MMINGNQPKELMEQQLQSGGRNAKDIEDKASNAASQGQEKAGPESKPSDPVINESNHEKVFLIDDSSNNIINEDDVDDDTQIRYLYSLYKNRLSNSF